ncbi:DUF4118 domain-containing protein [Streptomyces noursei]|uniref:DUF4118 domain-containing protein n=1 Tax=Streptomyces noursei TaxID=1971 RepID=UPI0035E04EC2
MVRYLSRDRVALAAALVLPPAFCALLLPFRGWLSNTNAALLLVVVVVAVAVLGHRLAGALAALSAAVWFDFFLTRPYERFAITKSADLATAVLLLAVGVAVSQLAARTRELTVIAITDDDYLAQIHHTARLVESAAGPDAVVDHVRHQLVGLLGLSGCRFEYGTLIGHPPRLLEDGSLTWGRRRWDADRDGLPAEEVELRVSRGGRFHGRFMLRGAPGSVPPLAARLVAVTLANQVGVAFEAVTPARA